MTAVGNWFRDKVGIASGIAISGFGLGGILLPVVSRLVDTYDWRRTMIIIAIGTLATILPLSFVFRHKPEQYGYLPDGRVKSQITPDTNQSPTQSTKMSQIIKSSVFWRIALAFTTHMILVGSTITHVMPYLSSIGVDRSTSSFIAMAIPLMSIGGRLTFGWLGDRFDRKRVAIGAFIMMSMGMLCFSLISNAGLWLLVPFLILFGIGYGGSNVTRASLTREYFGRSSFGTIFGFIVGINMMGSIAGSPLAGWVFDTWGSYQSIWLIYACLPIIALISILSIRPVRGELSNKT
jgi:MFS family permease